MGSPTRQPPEEALQLLGEMQQQGLQLNVVTVFAAFSWDAAAGTSAQCSSHPRQAAGIPAQ